MGKFRMENRVQSSRSCSESVQKSGISAGFFTFDVRPVFPSIKMADGPLENVRGTWSRTIFLTAIPLLYRHADHKLNGARDSEPSPARYQRYRVKYDIISFLNFFQLTAY